MKKYLNKRWLVLFIFLILLGCSKETNESIDAFFNIPVGQLSTGTFTILMAAIILIFK